MALRDDLMVVIPERVIAEGFFREGQDRAKGFV